jgi:hypothetical protein
MATAVEYGLIAAGISALVIGGVDGYNALKPVDPVKVRYNYIDTECAKRMPNGDRFEIARFPDGNYAPCPRRD